MKNTNKILFISGSPRVGNTNFLLSKIFNSLKNDNKEIILLKDKNIKFCSGCLACHYNPKCIMKDDMEEILLKMISSDFIVIATPNYFDNVSALTKNFIDRCHPLYKNALIAGKKVILVYVGGGKASGTKKYLDLSCFGFIKYLKLKLIKSYSFQALNPQDLKKRGVEKEVLDIIKRIG